MNPLLLQADVAPFPFAGEWAALAGAFVWGTASVMYARSLRRGDPLEAVWFKNTISAIALGLLAMLLGSSLGGGLPAEGEGKWLFLSGLIGMCLGDWFYFVAIAHIGIGRTVIITVSVPALTALLAWPIHGQELALGQWFGIALVVGGGMLAESRRFKKGSAEAVLKTDRLGVIMALAAVACWTIGNLVIHDGLHGTGPVTGGALRLAAGSAGFAIWFLLRGQMVPRLKALVAPSSWRAYGLPTFLGTVIGMGLYVGAFKWSKQGVAASLSSAVPLFAIPLSVWMLGERPGWRGWSGALVVLFGVAFVGQMI